MAARWGSLAKSGQKSCVYQFPCLWRQLCCVYEKGPANGHGHAHICRRLAQARVTQDPSRKCRPAMPSASDGAAHSDRSVHCCQRGLYSQLHIPSARNACAPAWQAGSGRGPAENQPRGKNQDSRSVWDATWLSLPWVPASAGDSAREALEMCGRASLVPFDNSVKSDLCNRTWNPRLVHAGQTWSSIRGFVSRRLFVYIWTVFLD